MAEMRGLGGGGEAGGTTADKRCVPQDACAMHVLMLLLTLLPVAEAAVGATAAEAVATAGEEGGRSGDVLTAAHGSAGFIPRPSSLLLLVGIAAVVLAATLPRLLGLASSLVLRRALRGRRVSRVDIQGVGFGGALVLQDVLLVFENGPVEWVHVREIRFSGEWRALAQIIGSSTTKKLPVAIQGVRVTMRNTETGGGGEPALEPKASATKRNEKSGVDGRSADATPGRAHSRLTWTGLLKATICWNVITMAELTVTDLVIDAHITHRCALVVQRIAIYSMSSARASNADDYDVDAVDEEEGGMNDEHAKVALYASSVRIKAMDGPPADLPLLSSDAVESPTLPSVAELESVSATAAIGMRGQRIVVDKLSVEPKSLDVKLGTVSMLLLQTVALKTRSGHRPRARERRRGDVGKALLPASLPSIELNMSEVRVRILGEMFPKSAYRQQLQRPVLSMRSIFVSLDRGSDEDDTGSEAKPSLSRRRRRTGEFLHRSRAWICSAGWSSIDVSDWSSCLSDDEIENGGGTLSLPFSIGRTRAEVRLESVDEARDDGRASVSGSVRVGDIHANLVGWRHTIAQLYARCRDVCSTGRNAVKNEKQVNGAAESGGGVSHSGVVGLNDDDGAHGDDDIDEGRVKGVAVDVDDGRRLARVSFELGRIDMRAMIGEDVRDGSEPDLGLYLTVHTGGAHAERATGMHASTSGQLTLSRISVGLLRKLTLNKPSSPSASSASSASVSLKSPSREANTRVCRFLETEIMSFKTAAINVERGAGAQPAENESTRAKTCVSVRVEDLLVVVRSRDITADTIEAVQSSLRALRSNAAGKAQDTAVTDASGADKPVPSRSIEVTLSDSVVVFDTASAVDIAAGKSVGSAKRKCALRVAEVCVSKMQPRHIRAAFSALVVEDRTTALSSSPPAAAAPSAPSTPILSVQDLAFEKLDVLMTTHPESRVSIETNHVQALWDVETHVLLLAVYDALVRAARLVALRERGHGLGDVAAASAVRVRRKHIVRLQLHDVYLEAKIDDNTGNASRTSSSSPPPEQPQDADVVAVALDFYSSHDIGRECEVDNLKILINDENVLGVKTLCFGPHASSNDYNERVVALTGLVTPVRGLRKTSESDDCSVTDTPSSHGSEKTDSLRRQHSFPPTSSSSAEPSRRPQAASFVHHQRSASNAELRYASARARSRADDFSEPTAAARVVKLEMMDVHVTVPSGAAPGTVVTNAQLMIKALRSLREQAMRKEIGAEGGVGVGNESVRSTAAEASEYEIRVVIQSFSFVAHHDKFEAWLRTRQGHLGKIIAENIARCDALSRSVGTMEVQSPSDASDDVWVRNGSFNSSSAVRELKMHMANEYLDVWSANRNASKSSTAANRILFRLDMDIVELLMIRPALRGDSDVVAAFVATAEGEEDGNAARPSLESGSSLWCVDVSASELRAEVCDTPVPLISSSSLTLSGVVAVYRQGGVRSPVCVTRNLVVGNRRCVSLAVPKAGARPPQKISTQLSLKLQQPAINFSVGMEPYLADLQHVIDRLIPKSPGTLHDSPPKRFPWFDRLRYMWRGNLDVTLSSAGVKLFAVPSANVCDDNPHVGIKFGSLCLRLEPSRQHLTFSSVTMTASRPVKVDCEVDMQCLKRQFQYNVVLAECPSLELDVKYAWTLVGGRTTKDHFLHGRELTPPQPAAEATAGAVAEGAVDGSTVELQDAIVLHDEYRSVDLQLRIGVTFGEDRRKLFDSTSADGDDYHSGPVLRMGAADVQWLSEFMSLLTRPPPGLRGASKRKRFGKAPKRFAGVARGLGQLISAIDVDVTTVDIRLINRAERDGDPADKMTLAATSLEVGVALTRRRRLDASTAFSDTSGRDGECPPALTQGTDAGNATQSGNGEHVNGCHRAEGEEGGGDDEHEQRKRDCGARCDSRLTLARLHVRLREPCLSMSAASADAAGDDESKDMHRQARSQDYDADCFIGSAASVSLSREVKTRGSSDNGGDDDERISDNEAALRVVVDGMKLFVTRDSRDAVFTCVSSYLDKMRRSATVRQSRSKEDSPDSVRADALPSAVTDLSAGLDVSSALPEKSAVASETKSDLLKLLLGSDASEESPDMNPHNPLTEQLQLLLDIRNPQFYLQSTSDVSSGRFLLAAAGGLVVGRKLYGSDGREKRAYTVSLSQVQGHVAQTESLADRCLRWLAEDALANGNADNVDDSSSLRQVFEPFALQLHVSRFVDDIGARVSATVDEAATQEISLSTPSIQVRMDSRQYAVFMDVVSNLLLAPMPAARHSSDMIPRAMTSDPRDVRNARAAAVGYHQEAAELIHMCAQIRGIDGCGKALEAQMMHAHSDDVGREVTLNEYISADFGGIEGRPYWWALRSSVEELEAALVEQWHDTRRKAAAATADLREMIAAARRSGARASSKFDVKVDRVAWNLTAGEETLVEAVIHDLNFTKMRREDSSGLTRFAVSETSVKTPDREIISMWYPPGVAHDEKGFLRIYAVQGAPTDGIVTYDHFEFGIHPTSVQISGPLLQRLWEYFFPRDSFGDDKRGGAVDTPVKGRHRRRGSRLLGGRDPSGNYDSIGSDNSSPASSFDDNDPTRSQGQLNVSALQRPLPHPTNTPIRHAVRRGRHRRVGSWDGVMIEMKDSALVTATRQGTERTSRLHARVPSRKPGELSVGSHSHSKSKSAIPSQGSSTTAPATAKPRAPKIRITYMRFNECHIMMSYEGNPISFNRPLVLDARTYNFFEGPWRDFINKLKWDVIRSVLKSVTGFQGRKLKDLELQTSGFMENGDHESDAGQSQVFAEGSRSMVVYLDNGDGGDHSTSATESKQQDDTSTPTRVPSHKRTASGKINPVRRLFRGRRSSTATSFDARDVAIAGLPEAGGTSEPVTPLQGAASSTRATDAAPGTPHSSLVFTSEEMKASMLGLRPVTKEKK